MASEKLIEHFKNSTDESMFSFHPFFVNYFSNRSPKKINIDFDKKKDEQLSLLKESIVTNFYLNKYFNSIEALEKKAVNKLINVLENKQINSDNTARHFFLLHISKSKLTANQFEYFFNNINSIRIAYNFEKIFSYEEFFQKLKKNKIFLTTIEKVLKKQTDQDLNLSKVLQTKILFFKSDLKNLNSFAGYQEIYINLNSIELLKNQMNNFDTKFQIIILKLYFIKLIVNHLSLMSIMATKNDINVSSEYMAIQPNVENLTQVEHLAEKLIFTVSIDWHKSVLSKKLDLDYLINFFNNFIEKDDLKEFDFENSGVVVEINPPCLFGIEQNSF